MKPISRRCCTWLDNPQILEQPCIPSLTRNNIPVETVQAAKVTDVQDLLGDPAADESTEG